MDRTIINLPPSQNLWVMVIVRCCFACQGAFAPRTPYQVHGFNICSAIHTRHTRHRFMEAMSHLCIATPSAPCILDGSKHLEQRRPLTGELQETCTPPPEARKVSKAPRNPAPRLSVRVPQRTGLPGQPVSGRRGRTWDRRVTFMASGNVIFHRCNSPPMNRCFDCFKPSDRFTVMSSTGKGVREAQPPWHAKPTLIKPHHPQILRRSLSF